MFLVLCRCERTKDSLLDCSDPFLLNFTDYALSIFDDLSQRGNSRFPPRVFCELMFTRRPNEQYSLTETFCHLQWSKNISSLHGGLVNQKGCILFKLKLWKRTKLLCRRTCSLFVVNDNVLCIISLYIRNRSGDVFWFCTSMSTNYQWQF